VVLDRLQTERLVEEAVVASLDADGEQHLVGLEGLRLALVRLAVLEGCDSHLHRCLGRLDLRDGVSRANVHAALLVDLEQAGGDVGILDGQDAIHDLDDGDFRAVGVIEVGELHADGAGADDDQFLRLLGQGHGFAGADDLVAVELGEGQIAGDGTCRDDDVVRRDLLTGRLGDLAGESVRSSVTSQS
jgi:hypothetical protein